MSYPLDKILDPSVFRRDVDGKSKELGVAEKCLQWGCRRIMVIITPTKVELKTKKKKNCRLWSSPNYTLLFAINNFFQKKKKKSFQRNFQKRGGWRRLLVQDRIKKILDNVICGNNNSSSKHFCRNSNYPLIWLGVVTGGGGGVRGSWWWFWVIPDPLVYYSSRTH